jgi:uncharacterized membrane protein
MSFPSTDLAAYERRATRKARSGALLLGFLATIFIAPKVVEALGMTTTVVCAVIGAGLGALEWFGRRPGTACGVALEAAARTRNNRYWRTTIVNIDVLALWIVAGISSLAFTSNGDDFLAVVSVVAGYAAAMMSLLTAPLEGVLVRESYEFDLQELSDPFGR